MQLWIDFFRFLLNESSQEGHRCHWHIWNLFLAKESPLQPQALVLPSWQSPNSCSPGSSRPCLSKNKNCFKHLWSAVPEANWVQIPKKLQKKSSWSLAHDIRALVQKSYTKSISIIKIYFSPFFFNYGKRWIMCLIWPIERHKIIDFYYQNNSHFHHYFPQKIKSQHSPRWPWNSTKVMAIGNFFIH